MTVTITAADTGDQEDILKIKCLMINSTSLPLDLNSVEKQA